MIKEIIVATGLLLTQTLSAQDKPECLEDVGQKMCLVKTDNQYGIIDKKGKYIVPAFFDEITVFDNAFIVKQKGKYGVIDRKGKIIIPVEYAAINPVDNDNKDVLFEINDIGLKAIFITKELDRVASMNTVTPTLLAGVGEVSIKDWFAYVKDVIDNGYNYNYGYEETLPDTMNVEAKLLPAYRAFLKSIHEDENMVIIKTGFGFYYAWKIEHYYDEKLNEDKKENMMNFPVTGITYKQAVRYTEWLTTIYRDKVNEDQEYNYEIKFRLPKADEWEAMALNGLGDAMKPNQILDSTNVKGCMLLNYKATEKCSNYEDFLKNSFGVGSSFNYSFFPDNNGCYNIFGNVAEMIQENGLAKGGSFNHYAKEAKTTETIEYDSPQPWLGFRVVAEFKKNNQ